MTDTPDLDWAAARCLEVVRRAEDRTCPACAPVLDDPTGCTLCGGTRQTQPVDRAMFNVADVAALALAHAARPPRNETNETGVQPGEAERIERRAALDQLSAEAYNAGMRY